MNPRMPAQALAATLALLGLPARAQPAPGPALQAPPVVVSATRTELPAFELPASIDRIEGEQLRHASLQVNLSESLGAVAGLQIKDRQNFAQDLQLSVRGFGARASFGIRGVRLYVDGIAATLPDGQGQLSNIDLASVERIEVLRGPFSALYGNASGGVLQAFTEEGRGPARFSTALAAGSEGSRRASLKVAGSSGALSYLLSGSAFETDGGRAHSAAERRLLNTKLGWTVGDTRLTLVGNWVSLPRAQDPLGLTRAQFNADPRAVDPVALSFDTRKSFEQSQLGLDAEHRLGGGAGVLQATLYGGTRETEQFQAIPVATQASALHPGGVIQLQREYDGADLRWRIGGPGGAGSAGGAGGSGASERADPRAPWLVLGVSVDRLREERRGRQNFVGSTLGVAGALRRDEHNRVRSEDVYAQGGWRAGERLSLSAGLRHSRVRFVSSDAYIVGANPDDSGAVDFSATNPVLGASFALSPGLRLYATAGRGFETPTLNELAYRADGSSGLNLALRAARSRHAELGLKARGEAFGELALAAFAVRTRDEIVTLSNVGGRATFTNAGATARSGAEASWRARVAGELELGLAAAWTRAVYRDAFLTCAATPCAQPSLRIPAGRRLPGVAGSTLHASAAWEPAQGLRGGVELRGSGPVAVNDANSDFAAGFVVANLHLAWRAPWRGGEWSLFVRVDNVTDKTYAGSVIVNEGNARFFEAAPGRTWLLGFNARLGS